MSTKYSDVFCETSANVSVIRDLDSMSASLKPLGVQTRFKRIFMASHNATVIQEYISKVERSLGDYQVVVISLLTTEI